MSSGVSVILSKILSLRLSGIFPLLQSLRTAFANSSGILMFMLEISPFSPYSISRYLVMTLKSLFTLLCPAASLSVTVNSVSIPSVRSSSPNMVSIPILYESCISSLDIVASSSIVGREFINSMSFWKLSLIPLKSLTINDSFSSRIPSPSRSMRASSRRERIATSLSFTSSSTPASSERVEEYLSPTVMAMVFKVAWI